MTASVCREANSALAALKRSDKKLQARLQDLSAQASLHGTAAAAARAALEQASTSHREVQIRSVAARKEQELMAGLGAARALLDQVQPKESFEALERCVQTLEGVALAAFYIEGESVGRSVPSVAELRLLSGSDRLRPHEGTACAELNAMCLASVECWSTALERWLAGESL